MASLQIFKIFQPQRGGINSKGQRPLCRKVKTALSPEGAQYFNLIPPSCDAKGQNYALELNPGLCPGLGTLAPSGLNNSFNKKVLNLEHFYPLSFL